MPKPVKLKIPNEILDLTLDIILGWARDNMLEKFFDLETIRNNSAVENYLGTNFGEELRTYIYVNCCRKLRKGDEHLLDEKGLLTILRCVLKKFGYKICFKHKYVSYVNGVYYPQYKIRKM